MNINYTNHIIQQHLFPSKQHTAISLSPVKKLEDDAELHIHQRRIDCIKTCALHCQKHKNSLLIKIITKSFPNIHDIPAPSKSPW